MCSSREQNWWETAWGTLHCVALVLDNVEAKQAAVGDSDRLQGLYDMNVLPIFSVVMFCETMLLAFLYISMQHLK